ncbi:ATP-dependent RNA helicase Atu4171, partial [hydrothermal vent metagenome]
MIEFEGVVPALAQALHKRGYTSLTPVQQAVLAPKIQNSDALVSAQTGSGKTVAFGLALAPMLLGDADKMARASVPMALVVTPTRELALQVKRELSWLYEETGAFFASCVGGMDMRDERRALSRGAHIVVGTPGRLKDHIMRRSLDMRELRAVVLDEADEMLDLGFREDLEFILDAMPKERRTLMFSATVSSSIANLAKKYQKDAQRINTQSEQKQHLDISYRALSVAQKDQENAIVNVLRYYEAKNALIFCGTRAMVNHMTARFNNRGFSVVALSGELSQSERTHALQAMRDGRARVCIATDVAARGIDLPNLELVIHAEIPKNRESLLHRSGRTGRAGRKGTSVLIVPTNARRYTERLLASAGVEATWALPPSREEVLKRDDQRILDNPALSEVADENELEFARQLLTRHGPEQIAAALVRVLRSNKSAPEELLDPGPAPSAGNART